MCIHVINIMESVRVLHKVPIGARQYRQGMIGAEAKGAERVMAVVANNKPTGRRPEYRVARGHSET